MFRKTLLGGFNQNDVLEYVRELCAKLAEAEEKRDAAVSDKHAAIEKYTALVVGCKKKLIEQKELITALSAQLEHSNSDYERLKQQEAETLHLLETLTGSERDIEELISAASTEAAGIVEAACEAAKSFKNETASAVEQVKSNLAAAENILQIVDKKADGFIHNCEDTKTPSLDEIKSLLNEAKSAAPTYAEKLADKDTGNFTAENQKESAAPDVIIPETNIFEGDYYSVADNTHMPIFEQPENSGPSFNVNIDDFSDDVDSNIVSETPAETTAQKLENQLPALDEELLKIIANLRAFGAEK